MSTINIKCVDQVLSFQNTPIITAGDQNVDKIQFDFCPTWDGFVKVAVFFKQKEECSYAMINADGSCNIPNSIMRLDGKIYIAVTGVNTKNQILTSNIVAYYVEEGIVDASLQDEFPNELDPEEQETVYTKILDMCVEMQDLCQDLIKNFAYVRFKGANEFEYDESKLEAKIRAYTYSRENLDTALSDLKEDLERTISDARENLQKNMDLLDGALGSVESNINGVNESIENIENVIDTEIRRLDQSIATLSSQIQTLSNRISALGG